MFLLSFNGIKSAAVNYLNHLSPIVFQSVIFSCQKIKLSDFEEFFPHHLATLATLLQMQ